MHVCAFPCVSKHNVNEGPMKIKSKSMQFRWKSKHPPSPLHPTGGRGEDLLMKSIEKSMFLRDQFPNPHHSTGRGRAGMTITGRGYRGLSDASAYILV